MRNIYHLLGTQNTAVSLFVLLLFILGVLFIPTSSWAGNICGLMKKHPSWHKAAKKSEKKWGVPVAVQFAIIKHESEFKANAKNRHSTARGYAQVLNESWRDYEKANGFKRSRNNINAATDYIGWYANEVKKQIKISPKNAYQFYLAYHEGIGGYRHMKRHPKPKVKRLARHVSKSAKQYSKQLAHC